MFDQSFTSDGNCWLQDARFPQPGQVFGHRADDVVSLAVLNEGLVMREYEKIEYLKVNREEDHSLNHTNLYYLDYHN